MDYITQKFRKSEVRNLALAAFAVRLLLIAYSVFHDYMFPVPYTDVDYLVVSDGARHMSEGRSPFDRETYRYTPLLALVFLPNTLLGAWWGKVILALCDVVAGYFVLKVLALVTHPTSIPIRIKYQRQSKLLVCCAIWFNPIVINVSTRGNSDIIIAALTLGSLAFFAQKRYWIAGLFLGFAVHMKIYPIIYAAPFVFSLLHTTMTEKKKGLVAAAFSGDFLGPVFTAALSTALAAAVPTAGCYLAYGQQFLHEAILYHVGRIDHRHNLSPYFLQMYFGLFDIEQKQQQQSASSSSSSSVGAVSSPLTSSLFAFIPQMLMLVVVSWVLRRNAAHAVALETMLFVAFNKVCTVQYFVWYLPFLPFILFSAAAATASASSPAPPKVSSKLMTGVIVTWVLALLLWMLNGKRLEFDGEDTFSVLWACSCLFFVAQVMLAVLMLRIALLNQKQKVD